MIIQNLIHSKKGQISMEFAILLGAAVVVASIAGFYYLKSVDNSSQSSSGQMSNTNAKISSKTQSQIQDVKEVLDK